MDGSGTGLDLGLLGSLGPTGEMELSVPVIEAPNIDLDMDHGQVHNLEPAPVQVAEILVDGKIHLVEIQAADVVMEDSVMLEDREESDYSIVHLDSNANELDLMSLRKINGNNESVTLWQVGLLFNYRKTVSLLPGATPDGRTGRGEAVW